MTEIFAGIDGGGTKTEAVVVTACGEVLKRFIEGPSNPNDIGMGCCCDRLISLIREMKTNFPSLKFIHLGIAGTSESSIREEIEEKISSAFPDICASFSSDTENLLFSSKNADIALISGTGSAVWLKEGEKRTVLGGWGYILDKGGSAYDIGKDGICAALSEEEGTGEVTLITTLIREKFAVSSVRSLIPVIYKNGRPFIAGLARTVFEAYDENDEEAEKIIDSSMKNLAIPLNEAARRLNNKDCITVAGGGLFIHRGDTLVKHLKKYYDGKIIIPDVPPVFGACRKCISEADVCEDGNFYNNFKESYGKYL